MAYRNIKVGICWGAEDGESTWKRALLTSVGKQCNKERGSSYKLGDVAGAVIDERSCRLRPMQEGVRLDWVRLEESGEIWNKAVKVGLHVCIMLVIKADLHLGYCMKQSLNNTVLNIKSEQNCLSV